MQPDPKRPAQKKKSPVDLTPAVTDFTAHVMGDYPTRADGMEVTVHIIDVYVRFDGVLCGVCCDMILMCVCSVRVRTLRCLCLRLVHIFSTDADGSLCCLCNPL